MKKFFKVTKNLFITTWIVLLAVNSWAYEAGVR